MKDKIKAYNALLDKFLDGSMCMDDRLDFIKKYRNDPIMIEQFNKRKENQQGIAEDQNDEVGQMIKDLLQEE